MATNPNFTSAVHCGIAQLSTANTNRDGTGTTATVLTAGSNGSRIDSIVVKAAGTTTAGMVRLFINDGTNTRLWREIAVTAVTPSASLPAFVAELLSSDTNLPLLLLPNGYSLLASTHNAETINVVAIGGSF